MPQTSYSQDMPAAIPGMLADGGLTDIISRLISTQGLFEVDAGTPANSTLYSVLITQSGATVQYDYTSDADATAAEISAGLQAAIAAGSQKVKTTDTDTGKFDIESTDEDAGITVTKSGGSTGFAATELVAHGQEAPFGIGVVTDPKAAVSGKQVRLPRATGEVTGGAFEGIVLCDTSKAPNTGGYADKSVLPVLRKGRVWLRSEDAMPANNAVYCRFQDPTASYGLGSFRSDADTADAVAVPTAISKTSCDAGGLFVCEINLP